MINVEFVKKLMDERGMKRRVLAEAMNVTESCLSRLLTGKRKGSLEVLEALATVFPDTDLRLFLVLDKPDKSEELR